ncbi:DUF4157 domain-containing protein [Streptomyces sp. NBC_01515]|uniref:eCIS core domain-containing protein n=1 Tax=Streptomyces sp. NBC_01515 TaxID=2903890 RepID=UPI00386381DE
MHSFEPRPDASPKPVVRPNPLGPHHLSPPAKGSRSGNQTMRFMREPDDADAPAALERQADQQADRVLAAGPADTPGASWREFFEPRFGADFSKVRLHTDAEAASSARTEHALAYTVGEDVVFGAGRYAPETAAGKRLLAHELAHVLQQRQDPALGIQRAPDDAAHAAMPTPNEFVVRYLNAYFMNQDLMVKELSKRLFWVMWQGEDHYPFVAQVLERLRDFNLDDDVARAMVLGGKDKDLDDLSATAAGRSLLDSMYEHIITGSLGAEDEQAARLILQAKVRQIPMETFIEGAERAQVFPVLQMGVTRLVDSPLEAELLPNGNIRVKLMSRVQHEEKFAAEVKTLPGDVFLRDGEELRPDQIVGVRDYDLGGDVEFFPAVALLMLSNKTETSTLATIRSVSITAATLGLFGGATAAENGLEQALRWVDLAAQVIGAIGTVVHEHREWATETFGAGFVRAVDVANNVMAVYGVARLAQATLLNGVDVTAGIRNRWRAIKAEKNFARLEAQAANKQLIDELDRAIASLPAPPETLRRRMTKAMDEWAEQPAGGLGALGAKEMDELLKAAWRKARNLKRKAGAKSAAKSASGASGASSPAAKTPPRTPPKAPVPAKPSAPKRFKGREEAARVVTSRGADVEPQAPAEQGMHVEGVPNRTPTRVPELLSEVEYTEPAATATRTPASAAPAAEGEVAGLIRSQAADAVAEARGETGLAADDVEPLEAVPGHELPTEDSEPGRIRELGSREPSARDPEVLQSGNDFNRAQRGVYAADELRLKNGKTVDGYTPDSVIVSRKRTQLADIDPKNAEKYVNEFLDKYGPGNVVSDTSANRARYPGLVNKPLRGRLVLEVPVQARPVPPEIGERARRWDITIRDFNGTVLN